MGAARFYRFSEFSEKYFAAMPSDNTTLIEMGFYESHVDVVFLVKHKVRFAF